MSRRADLARMVGISAAESQSQRVETRLIEPRSFSQSQATFELPQEGILSSDVALQIQLQTTETTANDRMDLPLMAGILGCIERAELFFGTTLISSVEELPHLMQLKNLFVDQDIRDQTHNVYLGSFSGMKTVDGGVSGVAAENGWGQLALNTIETTTQQGSLAAQGVLGLVQTAPQEANKLQHFRTTGNANTPFFCIKLKDIFPVLSQIPLPLFALKERVRFVFHFSPDLAGNRAVAVRTNAGSAAALPFRVGNLIQQASLKLSTDLIYYEDQAGIPSPMKRIQEELEKGANLVMTDYVSVFNTLPAVTGGVPAGTKQSQTISTLLGLDHQIVRNLLIATPPAPNFGAAPTEPANRILGNYLSKGSNDQTVIQISINNENIFPSPLNSTAKLYNELSQVHDKPLKVNRGLYSSNGQTSGAGAYPLVRQDAAFNSNQFTQGNPNDSLNFSLNYLGINLSKNAGENYVGNGIQVGRQPVIVTLTRDRVPTEQDQLRVLYWAECERMMMIKSGNIFMSGQ
tara:strand:+ start:1431 stop:2984 length:1554 start_codon:yes stop_codon:yes gene_type:complete